ncbi:hypothetical protein DUNSADRAFT_12285 [Dunaliella salina]|uniref:Encoded protein n=1 Tax=Dunaliella salina TaxID=3046 RepID=A0ABQ7H405_DUNSA|nr:hypothetical protein DUNSADRAFT_12285 [Dunaliella salina]|eukprot:KAF5841586.1 hypothetical protein DUNSADRAFT_12285 [Dunaliella salina]
MPYPDEEEGLYWQNSPPSGTPSNGSLHEDEGTTRTDSQAAEGEGDSLNTFLHEPWEDDRHGSAGELEPEWGSEQTREFDPVYLAGDSSQEDDEDKGHTDDGTDYGEEEDQQQRQAAPEDVDSFMFEEDARPKEHVQFFFEMGYADQDVDDRLPSHIRQNRTARKQASEHHVSS